MCKRTLVLKPNRLHVIRRFPDDFCFSNKAQTTFQTKVYILNGDVEFEQQSTSVITDIGYLIKYGIPSRSNLLHRRYASSDTRHLKTSYDAIIIGGGHNGLVAAAYLQKFGLNVCVLERRHVVGGAAVTEEIVPGFKFSRASYLLSLMKPDIINDLQLKKHGLKCYIRDPSSYTPVLGQSPTSPQRSLTLGRNSQENVRQLARFSEHDAKNYECYEEWLNRIVSAVDPLLTNPPVHLPSWVGKSATMRSRVNNWRSMKILVDTCRRLNGDVFSFYELLTSPASKILNRWFESDVLKATLATDSVIGAMTSPFIHGSGYVLLHHVVGEIEGIKGAWAYVEGGMGALSNAIASSAQSLGASIFTNKSVKNIIVNGRNEASGVVLEDGTEIKSTRVLSNATARVTYLNLLDKKALPEDFRTEVEMIDYTSPVTKINVAVSQLPSFTADPTKGGGNDVMPHHRTTIHINCESMDLIHDAYVDATAGRFSKAPVIEMTIPSSLDSTLAPPGCHVVQLFTQYTPYRLSSGEWTTETKQQYADIVFECIERYAPGFKKSIVGVDILTPPDLEQIFGLSGGNIFHGAMTLDQLYFGRPTVEASNYRSPVTGLYLCGSGSHPGGGVMGLAGKLAAQTVIGDKR